MTKYFTSMIHLEISFILCICGKEGGREGLIRGGKFFEEISILYIFKLPFVIMKVFKHTQE